MALIYLNVFKSKKKFDEILGNELTIYHISPNQKSLTDYRDDLTLSYKEKYMNLLKSIFGTLDNVVFSDNNKNNKILEFNKILPLSHCKIHKDNFSHLTNGKIFTHEKKFLVLNTKIVNSSILFNQNKSDEYNYIYLFNKFKNEFYSIINDSNLQVVIIGEREIPKCKEYDYHKDNFGNYNMYYDHINNLKNFIDESYEDSKDGYDYDLFVKTCYFLQNSVCNIFIGNGGGIHLYSQFENTIQFGLFDRLLELIPKENIETGVIGNIIDYKKFLDVLGNKIL